MEDRREQIREYARPFFEEAVPMTGEAALEHYKKHREQFYAESIEPFDRVMKRAGRKPVKYMVIAFLYSSVLTGSRKYKIILYNDLYYLDQTALTESAYFRFLDPFLDEDIKKMTELVGKRYIRLTGYEKDTIKLECGKQYKSVLMHCFEEVVCQIIQLESYKNMHKQEGFTIIIGEYMGNGSVAYRMPPV